MWSQAQYGLLGATTVLISNDIAYICVLLLPPSWHDFVPLKGL